jgi:hypothetical protein
VAGVDDGRNGGSGEETDLAALPRDAGTTEEVVDHEHAELSSGRASEESASEASEQVTICVRAAQPM